MSNDPRGYRGYSGNQRHSGIHGRENDQRGGGRGDARVAQRGYSHIDQSNTEDSESNPAGQASFSSYRPQAYAGDDKRASHNAPAQQGRQDWNNPQSSMNDPYSQQASERSASQRDYRDPYDSGYNSAPVDPYSVHHRGVQQEYVSDWQQPSYRENNQYSDSGSYYDPPSQIPDPQAVHDRYFMDDAGADIEPAARRYNDPGYGDAGMPPLPRYEDDGYGEQMPPPPPRNGGYSAEPDYYDDYEPAPQSVRPRHQLPALSPHHDDLGADYFDDEYYDNGDFPEEHRGGSKKLIAAVLIGAVLTGGGLAYLYRTAGQVGGDSPKMVEADPSPVKGEPDEVSGSRFSGGNKSIYDRLGSGESSDTTDTTASAESTDTQPATPAMSGTLEERIQSALNDAKNLDTPRSVQTMSVRPDGTFESSQSSPASETGNASQGVVVTSMGSNSQSVTAPAPQPEATPEEETSAPEPEQSQPMLVQERATPQKPTNVAMLTPQTPAVQSGGTGGVFVQIAARQQQDQALAAYSLLQRKYPAQLGNYSPTVRMVDLAEKGKWYRLWVGPMNTKSDAEQLCSDLKTAGLRECLVRVDN